MRRQFVVLLLAALSAGCGRSDSSPVGLSSPQAISASAISPNSGSTTGGTAVTITGSAFAAGATVSFGGTIANSAVVGATSITATTPAHAAGAVDVVVANSNGQSSRMASAFTYVAPPPAPASLSPASGSSTGGTIVTITGTGFSSGATVTFGGTAATSVAATSTSIVATTPAHAAGAVDVAVTNPDGQSGRITSGYTYAASFQGSWSGLTSRALPISFAVSGTNGITTLQISYLIQGSGCTTSGTTTVTFTTPLAISNSAFTYSSSTLAVSGTFTSGSAASGTATVTSQSIPGVPSCIGSVSMTWNATKS